MPGYKDLRKGKYANSALAYSVDKVFTNNNRLYSMVLSPEEMTDLTNRCINYFEMSEVVDYDDRFYSRSGNEPFAKAMTPDKDKIGIELLEYMHKLFKKAVAKLGKEAEDFKGIYGCLESEFAFEGNLMEARFESQYLTNVNQLGGQPRFGKFPSDEIKKGLLGEFDEATGKYKGPYEPMEDYFKYSTEVTEIEFIRQKYNEEGWTKEKEEQFLADLKAKQEKLVDSFERLYAVEDNGQYDKYLNNELDHITGKTGKPRSAYTSIGAVKGQIKAIENGWGQDELVVLGAIGMMEAHLKMLKDDFEAKMALASKSRKLIEKGFDNLNDKEIEEYAAASALLKAEKQNRELLTQYEKDLKALKDKAWNTKINKADDKEDITKSVSDFITKYHDSKLNEIVSLYYLNGAVKAQEGFVNEVMNKLTLAKNNALANENVINNNEQAVNNEQPVNNKQNNEAQKPEEYELVVDPDSLENHGFSGNENERKRKADIAKQAYAAQSSKEDKILFYLSYCATNTINLNAPLSNMTIEIPAGISDEEKATLKQQADERLNAAVNARKAAGMNAVAQTSEQEDNCQEELKNKLILDLIGDGSRENIVDSFKAFGIVNALNINNQGKKFKELYDALPKNEPNREKKALYLAYKNQGIESMLNSAISSFSSLEFVAVFNFSDDLGLQVKEKIFNNLKYNKDSTTFKDFFDKLGFTQDERNLYIANNGCKQEDKLYDFYKAKLLEENEQEPEDNDIFEAIKEAYTSEFQSMIVISAMKGPAEYFLSKYNENMTINHYMNILRLNDEEKQDFLQYYGVQVTDTVHNAFKKYIDEHEDIKNRILDENEKNERPREITNDNIRDFAKNLLGEEFARKRKKQKEFEEKYTPDMTALQFMNILDLDDFEKNEFLSSYDVNENAKIRDIFAKELMQEKKANVTEEEIKAYAAKKLSEMVDEQNNSQKYTKDKNVWGNMYVHFADNIGTFGDKMIYKKGHIVNGGEGLVPKNNPKTESQKEFKNWVETTGQKMLEDSYLSDQMDAFKKASDTAFSKKAINLRNDDFVADYFDSAVPISNTTFLQGVITALENTKTGKKWNNANKDRSSNSKEYEKMLSAIKDYQEMMVTDDKFGLVGARDILKQACLNYISGKESVRRSDFGKERFDVAMTVLFDIMPRKDFANIIHRVNAERNEHEYVNFDTYNVKYASLYSAEEARQEERQVQAEKKYLTDIPKDYEEKFENVLNVYGLEPKGNDALNSVFDEFELTFAKVPDKLVTIGNGLGKRNLSNEDFAAIAYAGTLTDAATEHDTRYSDADLKTDKLLVTAKDYTVSLAKQYISPEVGMYSEVIASGRNAAIDAMKEYEKGNKFLLATVLSAGIRHIAAMSRFSDCIDENFICNGEMGRRMVEMLDRDAALKHMVLESYQGINDDISYIDTINQASKIFIKASAATEKFVDMVEDPKAVQLNADQKQELITDIMMLKVLDSSKEMYHKSVDNMLKTDPKYKSKMLEIEQKEIDERDQAIAIEDKERRNNLLDAIDYKKKLRIKVLKDNLRNDKLLLTLTNDKSVGALRESVKGIVKDGGFDRLKPEEILNKINDKKLLSKLGTMTKTANEKSANEYGKRKALEHQKRVEAQNKKKARRQTKAK